MGVQRMIVNPGELFTVADFTESALSEPRAIHSTYSIGQWAEGRFISWASLKGWWLYKGIQGHEPADFIADTGTDIYRIEVKGSFSHQNRKGTKYHSVFVRLVSQHFDFIFIATPQGEYLIPAEVIPLTGYLAIGENQNRRCKWRKYRV